MTIVSEKSPLIISDFVNHFANSVAATYSPNSPHALTLKPYIETIIFKNIGLPTRVLSSGAATSQPNTLIAETTAVVDHQALNTLYHINTNEQSDHSAKTRAEITRQAFLSQENTAQMLGGGLLLAGMKVKVEGDWLIRDSHIDITFDEHHPERLGSIATRLSVQDASVRYQMMPQFGEHASLITGIKTGTPGTDMGANLMSVNEQGHYHATLPPTISSNTEAHGVQVFDTRMLQPMHSDDHRSHMTLPTDSEGVMLWSEGFSGEPLMLGTLNNLNNIHPTTSNNPQNAYWQDHDTNKLAFINQGPYVPFQNTGRKTATLLETPSYDLRQNKSYVRLGDQIDHDAAHPAQAAEPGVFLHTSGNYHEQHHGGLLTLFGNLYQDPQKNGFTPILRHMIQLAQTLDAYHILHSVTAHFQSTTLTSDGVTQTHTQDATTIHQSLTATNNSQNYHADTVDNVYVNQQHQTQGDSTSGTFNTHVFNATSNTTTLTESGDQTSENHDTHTLNLNHLQNQFSAITHTTTTTSQTTQVSALSQNFTAHKGTADTLNINSDNTLMTANNAKFGSTSFYQGSSLSISSGSATPANPSITDINDNGLNALADEAAMIKKAIVFLLDFPNNPPSLQLVVNQLNPQMIPANNPFTYPLAQEQKRGTLALTTQIQGETVSHTLHPQIRNINLQYKAPMQQQNPWFTPEGKLPIYMGARPLAANQGIDFSDTDQNIVMLKAMSPPPASCLKGGGFQVNSVDNHTISWLMQQLHSANKSYPYGANNQDSGWEWNPPSVSDYIGVVEQGVTTFAMKHNREFVLEFFNQGNFYLKKVRGEWMLVFKGAAGLRKWVKGTTYSLDNPKVAIFKTYALAQTPQSALNKSVDFIKDARSDARVNFLLAAPLETVQYFFFDDDPNKQISDLFVNIGIDMVNTEIAGALAALTVLLVSIPFGFGLGLIVVIGIPVAALMGWILENAEENLGIRDKFVDMGRSAQDLFTNQNYQLKINLPEFAESAVQILTAA